MEATQLFTRLQSQVNLFVRIARRTGLESDWLSLLNGKPVPQQSLARLDSLLKHLIVSSPVKPTTFSTECFAETSVDPITKQNIFRFEIPTKVRLAAKENAIAQSPKDEAKAKQIYKSSIQAIKADLIKNFASKQVEKRNPPLRTGVDTDSPIVKGLNDSIAQAKEQYATIYKEAIRSLNVGTEKDREAFITLQDKLKKYENNIDFGRAIEGLIEKYYPPLNLPEKELAQWKAPAPPATLKEYCDIVAPYVVKDADPSILYDILSTQIGSGSFLNMLQTTHEICQQLKELPDLSQDLLLGMAVEDVAPTSRLLFTSEAKFGHPVKDLLISQYIKAKDAVTNAEKNTLDNVWKSDTVTEFKKMGGKKPINWSGFYEHPFTNEFYEGYKPWLDAVHRSQGIFGNQKELEITEQPFWRILHGYMEKEVEFRILNNITLRKKVSLIEQRKEEMVVKQVALANMTSTQLLDEIPLFREFLEWHVLRGRYISFVQNLPKVESDNPIFADE
eukprot:TRINITY_DN3380_c0_g1_i1.p2 TRINITY_DN3380_c0_g1~~TRINITY_DN3380_c0_g1_i1.p2  ORF type:complete len:504 (-),score=295.62 TRINITY_DN3380_c0_g1_i1:159-1670(-)